MEETETRIITFSELLHSSADSKSLLSEEYLILDW